MTGDPFEARLCDALMKILGTGVHEISAVADGLNQAEVLPPGSPRWSAELLCGQLRLLARPPEKKASPSVIRPENGSSLGNGPAAPQSSPKTSNLEDHVEHLVRHGLRNQWYLVAASAEVTDKPLGIKRLGERLVLWRDQQGRVQALQDRCPHRGAALSIGEVKDGALACAYHGVRVDGHGRVVKVPAIANCPLEGQQLVHHYPVIEHYQAIWAYFGDELHRAPPPLELPDELISPEWTGMLHYDTWSGHYQYVYDNLCDPMHGPYLHGRSYTQQYGPKDDKIKVKKNDRGFEVFREGQRGVNFDWMEIIDAGSTSYARVEIPLPPSAGPGGPMGIIFYVTPIDDGQTRINAWRLRKVSGWQRDLWHVLFDRRIRNLVDAVLAQDKMAMAALPPWPAPENLYQHDIGIATMRRRIKEAAHAQAQALSSDAR